MSEWRTNESRRSVVIPTCMTQKAENVPQERYEHNHRLITKPKFDVDTAVPTSGVNSRVHEGCQAEVGQDEEEDQAIVERHSGRDNLRQPGTPENTHV